MFLFVFRSRQDADPGELAARKALLRREFGDAAACVSLMAGEGTGLAMICTSMSSARSGWIAGRGSSRRNPAGSVS